MKKHWLQMLVVFCLGVATIPGTVLVERWLRNSGSPPPRFTEVKLADFSPHEADDFEQYIRVENSKSEPQGEPEPQSEESNIPHGVAMRNLVDRTRSLVSHQQQIAARQNSAAAAHARKSVHLNFDSEVEPPVLVQNSPSRKPTFSQPVRTTDAPVLDDFEPVPVKQQTATANSKTELPDGIESLAEANLSDEQKAKLTTLREKLAELTKAKAELVNEQTLTETIASLEKQISDLHAAQKLLSAQQILRALAEEFPDSPAAAKAKWMLEAAETKKSPKPSPVPGSTEPFGG